MTWPGVLRHPTLFERNKMRVFQDEIFGPVISVARFDGLDDAAELLRELTDRHGSLMFHQSGGCCDGSAPMCYPDEDLILGNADVHLGDLDVALDRAIPVWISRPQYEYWKHTHLTIDVVPGRGAGFSVEAPTGQRFIIRSRLLTDEEVISMTASVGSMSSGSGASSMWTSSLPCQVSARIVCPLIGVVGASSR